MPVSLILALPLALTWMLVTGSVSLDSLLVGLVIGVAISVLVRPDARAVSWRALPDQLVALVVYSVTLCRDIFLSSVDVAKRVLNPNLPMNPGVLAVSTQDADENDVVTAFSAHGITITPGELVVDFDGGKTMYVHCLDVEASAQSAPAAQAKRLRLLNRILGRSVDRVASVPPSIQPEVVP